MDRAEEQIASFGRMVLSLAAIAIVLGALHVGSAFVTPVLLALVLALIFWPVYTWLRRRGLASWLALLALLVGLGVDFPLLWGVLTFFLSFIPYIGMFVASVPSVLLAWAEYDLGRALLVIVALTVVNATAENLLQPVLMHKGLHSVADLRHPVRVLLVVAAERRGLISGRTPVTGRPHVAGKLPRGAVVRERGNDQSRH
jgi:predicted PurR-regulated permease PerM